MTQKRPQHGKPGPKSIDEKIRLDAKLRELFLHDGITPWRASIIAQCSYEYAVKKFREFAVKIVESEEQDWVERHDQVRKRILEGISKCIEDSQSTIELIEDQIKINREILDSTKNQAFEQLQSTQKSQKNLELYNNYSLLMLQNVRELRAERNYAFVLLQQYNQIELTAPLD